MDIQSLRRALVQSAVDRKEVAVRFNRGETECVTVGRVMTVDVRSVHLVCGKNDSGYTVRLEEIVGIDGAVDPLAPAAGAT